MSDKWKPTRAQRRAMESQPEIEGFAGAHPGGGIDFTLLAFDEADFDGDDSDLAGAMQCRECGCWDLDCSGCVERTGEACYWVEDDLCSACAAAEARHEG